MNKQGMKLACLALLTAAPAVARAQGFDTGSNGSYGPINITTTTTLDMPADGIFHATTINVASGATLKFNRNPANTAVYLLATGDVTIAGTIDVSGQAGTAAAGGRGGPGGFDGGSPGNTFVAPGAGQGPGGGAPVTICNNALGLWSAGHFAKGAGSTGGDAYGTQLLFPLIGGSGGGGARSNCSSGGGGGGGAILVASPTQISLTGVVNASAQTPQTGWLSYASGGAIRFVTPKFIGDLSRVTANGSGASVGRMRIDTIDRRFITGTPPGNMTLSAFMQVFPTPEPTLSIIQVAGQTIAEGNYSDVSVLLPVGTSPNQQVTVLGRNLFGTVPVVVSLKPLSGTETRFNGTLDFTSSTEAQTTIDVTFPINEPTRVEAWTAPTP